MVASIFFSIIPICPLSNPYNPFKGTPNFGKPPIKIAVMARKVIFGAIVLEGLGFRNEGLGLGIKVLGFKVEVLEFKVKGLGI